MQPTDGDGAVTDKLLTLVSLCLLLIAQCAVAETVYVTDVLQLGMYETENSGGQLLRNLASGTRLVIAERKGYYARVRTSDGLEGWTKAAFLVTEKPARLRLNEIEQQRKALSIELGAIRQELSTQEKTLLTQTKKLAEATRVAETSSALASRLEQESQECLARLAVQAYSIPLNWALAGGLVSLVIGLIGGIALFDYRSRRRHGGFRIH